LIYHSIGILSPVTFVMHAAAAVPMKYSPPRNRAAVIISGGREPTQWEAYPHHRFLSLCGCLDCCDNGGCWKSRCQKVGDGDNKDNDNLCLYPVEIREDLRIPKCLDLIRPSDVIRAIEWYYEGGVFKYNGEEPKKEPKEELKKEPRKEQKEEPKEESKEEPKQKIKEKQKILEKVK